MLDELPVTALPFLWLEYLYVGTADFARDLAYYKDVVGAEVEWSFEAFGAKVAALRLGGGPLYLLADHRPPGTCMPIYAVLNLSDTALQLRSRGWIPDGDRFDIPNGPCYRFTDPSGNQVAIFQNDRPNAPN